MGLDMRPMGKPIEGFEMRFVEIYKMITLDKIPKPNLFDRILRKKFPTKDELLQEWFANQIKSYETIKAPKVGRDQEATNWLLSKFNEKNHEMSFEAYLKKYDGYFVIELAKELDGVPLYISMDQDANVFRGQFLKLCIDIIGEDLVYEAWNSKLANETLVYGKRLMEIADQISLTHNLAYLKSQREIPESDEDSIELKLHIVYSLAKWLIFYGRNGHGYEADF